MKAENDLARLSEAKLCAWILARMRGQKEDPHVDESRFETPDVYLLAVYQEAQDAKFRARLEKATIRALEEAAAGDLSHGPDARAVRYLADLLDGMDYRDAAPLLRKVAEGGVFGGNVDCLDADAEETVLAALAGLQAPGKLWPQWEALWTQDIPRLWAVVTLGLRFADPTEALALLPEIIERLLKDPDFPLGEVLWAFATDERYAASEFAGALAGLSAAAQERCREALRELGATPGELDVWVPNSARGEFPEWARLSSIDRLPLWSGAPICP